MSSHLNHTKTANNMIDFGFFQIFLLVIIFGLFFGLVFLPVILSFLGPSEWHSHSPNDYELAPDGTRRRRSQHRDDANSNDKEMISFIQPNENNDKTQKDIH